MDPRLNYGDGFSFPRENFELMGSWMPTTPEKLVQARSNPTPLVYQQGNHELGVMEPELAPFPESYLQNGMDSQHWNSLDHLGTNGTCFAENASNLTDSGMFNHIAVDSYRQPQVLSNETAAWNDNALASLLLERTAARELACTSSRPIYRTTGVYGSQRSSMPNLHSLVNNWKEPNLAELLPAKTHSSYPNSTCCDANSSQLRQDVFHAPRRHNYDLNSAPVIEASANSNGISSHSFTPITSDQGELENCIFYKSFNLSQQIRSTEVQESQHEPIVVKNEKNQQNSAELLHDIVELSSAVISTLFEEPKDLERGNDKGIDLNRTPQKPPKRRKHRPKVVVEGKPKRTPKPATEVTDTNAKSTGKRKYVRKKGTQESVPDKESSVVATMQSSTATGPKSCRRQLNFDLENVASERSADSVRQRETWTINEKQVIDDSYIGINAVEARNGVNAMCRARTALNSTQEKRLLVENQHTIAASNLTTHINQLTNQQTILERQTIAQNLSSNKNIQEGNLNNNARAMDLNNMRLQKHVHTEGQSRAFFLAKQNSEVPQKDSQLVSQNATSSESGVLPNLVEVRGSKREHCHVEQAVPPIRNTLNQLLCQEMYMHGFCHQNSNNIGVSHLENHKRMKTVNGIQVHTQATASAIASVNFSSQQNNRRNHSSIGYMSQRNQKMAGSNSQNKELTDGESSMSRRFINEQYLLFIAARNLLPKQQMSETHSWVERMGQKNGMQFQNVAPLMAIRNFNRLPLTPLIPGPAPGNQAQNGYCNADVPKKQKIGKSRTLESLLLSKERMSKEQDIVKDHNQSSAQRRGRPAKQKYLNPIEEIIYRMEGLYINQSCKQTEDREQYALVPYKADGTLIPYEGFELIKKRKPRPKVDLDPETDRVWKLLMGKDGNENIEGTDEEKKKWWEEERRVFRGRADSFIARMHLVQGDRRFSKWKGSVVDSVIGVFLTQNVSDHLSSSAYMSLAARFPLKSETDRTCKWDGSSALVEDSDACSLSAGLRSCPLYDQDYVTRHDSTKEYGGNANPCIERIRMADADSHSQGEELISSQGSLDSTIVLGNEAIRSASGSNSEVEDAVAGCKTNNHCPSSVADLPEIETTTFEEFYNHISGSSLFQGQSMHQPVQLEVEKGEHRKRLERSQNLIRHSPMSSYPQLQDPAAVSSNHQLHASAKSKVLEIQGFTSNVGEIISSRPSSGSESPMQIYTSERHPYKLASKQSGSECCSSQPSHCNQPSEINKCYPLKNSSVVGEISNKQKSRRHESINSTERITSGRTQINLNNEFVETGPMEQAHSQNMINVKANTDSLRIKKPKEVEKKDAVDWDSLRKQAQANRPRKERSKEHVDSLDYEALRCASVSEISETIKERGMNNLLAERIKEFLDRLVEEHESIDLEWLRDVPPDKAKDYLLSMRGLGLKSVECVRLLTLHHLAFPVDTNVGRIAVRLGWVPLQPLPEALQLHLLELYPILESIQKYLWPRLCKLDQQTLYELHYQLITFGKVFCTKSRPNCNACPMRAECRHFASAYASARLALPGPEEKSITKFTAPSTTERTPGIVINPMPLPPAEESTNRNAVSIVGNCEPIIEEPATPQQENIEIAESDIEDAFYEDPEEIPTIKLSIEEFSANLQNYVQANMEVQEGDMSKALVALDPAAASVPTTKLKNISRLRTEHHVYRLPDSHPLLDGMDRREPDDPSPYLLAIWSPGETANSVQLPQSHCNSKESNQLCNEQHCFSCNSIREANSQTVRGTLLIPCRTAMRGSFPLNGTYFQVNEMFADHESSLNPIDVPRSWLWNLPRRIVYFGTSVSSIFRGLSTQEIQFCFWKGFVCVRGFDQKTRAPRPLIARLHFPATKLKKRNENKQEAQSGNGT